MTQAQNPEQAPKQPKEQHDPLADMPRPTWGRIAGWLVLLMISWWLVRTFFGGAGATNEVPYSTFRQQLQAGNVTGVTIQGEQITGEFAEPV